MRNRYVIAALAGALLLAGCGGSATSSPGVPALSQAAQSQRGQGQGGQGQGGQGQGAQAQGAQGQGSPSQGARDQAPTSQLSGSARAAALHAAAQCIRQHGVPSYTDPVLTASGQVYSDSRSIQDASQSVLNAVQQACGTLAARAGLDPSYEPPAPPQLVEAGVRSAECLRAHGLPNVQDPSARTPYTPGHGFGFTANEIPAGGKADPAYQAAAHACRPLLDAEISASTLASLSNDG
jgi:hypothetical protein